MNGAELLCNLLEQKGVKHIFGLFGDIETDFAHAVRKSNIRWIGVHNEKCGGFMADVYARVSDKPGVVFSTLGPGATNLTTALANATQDRSPLIAISDQSPTSELKLQTHQYIDFTRAFHQRTGITKYAGIVKNIQELPTVFEQAFSAAITEPKGAVHITIPADLFGKKAKKGQTKFNLLQTLPRKSKTTISYAHLVKALQAPSPGLVIVGQSIIRAHAEPQFRQFIERMQLPVLTTFHGKDVIPSDHPQCLGTISRHLGKLLQIILRDVSYVLTIGFDYIEGVKPSMWQTAVTKTINIDMYDNRVRGIFYPPTYIGDLKEVLARLATEKRPTYKHPFPFRSMQKKLQETVIRALDVQNKKLHPRRIIDAVNDNYHENAVILCDVGLNKYYSGLLLKSTPKNRILFSNGLSSMAFTMGALGAKIARPKKDVVVLVGDGGFLMDLQEIITTALYGQPIVWIIFNNGGLGLIEQAQLKTGQNHHGVRFGRVTFKELAKALGLYGYRVGIDEDVTAVIKKAKKRNAPAIIDVPVDYTPHPAYKYR